MVSISVSYQDLQKFLNIASQISPKKNELEIITYTKINIGPKGLFLESSHLNNAFFGSVPVVSVPLAEEISFLIKTDLFSDCINSFNGEVIDLGVDLETHQITIKVNMSKAKLRINTDLLKEWREFKQPNKENETSLKVFGKDFISASRLCLISVGQPKIVLQPEFLNICFSVDTASKKLALVSSDKFRLSLNNTQVDYISNDENQLMESANFIIPAKIVSLLSRVVEENQEITIRFTADDVWFEFGAFQIFSQYIDGKYPDYNKIIPQSFSCSMEIDKEELHKAIKQVYFLSRNQFNKDITFQVKPTEKKIKITSKADVLGESENEINILAYEGDDSEWQQSFNATYFLDYLNLVSDEIIVWDANPGKPSVLYAKNFKEKSLYLVCGLNR